MTKRVLILGRSAPVLVDSVAMLRDLGYRANASNQFDRTFEDYDLREVDLVVLGGMVPAATKEWLRSRGQELNPGISFVQGLGGISRLLTTQVEEFFRGAVEGLAYDPAARTLRVPVPASATVTVEALWAEFVPPDPVPRSHTLLDDQLPAGTHEVTVPDEVPREGSYLTVRVGERVSALKIGETPAAVSQAAATGSLPAPEPVTTQLPWN